MSWARAWVIAAVYVLDRAEDITHGFAWLLCMARVRLLIRVGVRMPYTKW